MSIDSIAVRMAFHEIDQDATEEKSADQSAVAAKKAMAEAQTEEVEKLHAGAHDIRVGAAWSAGLAVGGAALSTTGSLTQGDTVATTSNWSKLASGSGGLTSGLSKPVGACVGDAPKADHDADAAAARSASQQAQSSADAARNTRATLEKHDDRAFSVASQSISDARQDRAAALGNIRA